MNQACVVPGAKRREFLKDGSRQQLQMFGELENQMTRED